MKKKLSETQIYVITMVEHRGSPWIAHSIRQSWENGESAYVDSRAIRVLRGIRKLFDKGNSEALAQSE